MQSRSGLFAFCGAVLVSGASGCGLLFDYSDYSGSGGAGDATTTTGNVTSSASGTNATRSPSDDSPTAATRRWRWRTADQTAGGPQLFLAR